MMESEALAQTATASVEGSQLLQLPAELRNLIWRYAVVKSYPITVNSDGFRAPTLFAICKQTRNETVTLFFAKNVFQVIIGDYDIRAYAKWENTIYAIFSDSRDLARRITRKSKLHGTQVPNWFNLVLWTKMAYEGSVKRRMPRPSDMREERLEFLVIGAMFTRVERMGSKPWADVEELLEDTRIILAKIDPRWDQ